MVRATEGPIRALVIDDSAQSRRAIQVALSEGGDVEVVGVAHDGKEGLRKALELLPDVITLDLEMPGLDGFTFLRLIMAQAPTPVIVLSSYALKADVFKALELGAFDFVAKSGRGAPLERALGTELLEKVRAVRLLRPTPGRGDRGAVAQIRGDGPLWIVGVGASTGGPPAIQALLQSLAGVTGVSMLLCQHMPPRFTRAFAERLDRLGPFSVKEAESGDRPAPGTAYVAPGGGHLLLLRRGGGLRLEVVKADANDKYVPSVDRLFESLARTLGDRALGVVLTGMSSDGAQGARAIRAAGGEVWAESEESAVVYGMPKEVVDGRLATRVLPLGAMGVELERFGRGLAKKKHS